MKVMHSLSTRFSVICGFQESALKAQNPKSHIEPIWNPKRFSKRAFDPDFIEFKNATSETM
jgi:hypothetical protein